MTGTGGDSIHVGRLDPAEWLGRTVSAVMDRPLGSLHPKAGFRYEVNYGFVPGFISPDGEELDVYVLGTDVALSEATGVVIGVVLRRDDVEDKLVIGLGGSWDAEAITAAIGFQEQFFDLTVVTAATLS